MSNPKALAASSMLGIASLVLVGCGGEENLRRAVSGSVQVDSADGNGLIRFYPARGNHGPSASAVVVDGQYAFTTETGPHSGAHRVVFAMDNPPQTAAASVPSADATEASEVEEPLTGKQGLAAKPDRPRRNSGAASKEPEGKLYGKWEREYVVPAEGKANKDFAFQTTAP
ncbi:MAG: hypothetical protein AB8B91_14805 [Rubripirellula sp.]